MTFSCSPTTPLPPRPAHELFTVDQRIRLAAWTDEWMQGDRHGTVTNVGTKLVTVTLEPSGRSRKFNANSEAIAPIYT